MSHRKPSKTKFNDLWRDDADCLAVVAIEPEMATAWDNVEVEPDVYEADPKSDVAKLVCYSCAVRERCLKDALTDNEAEGIRGGYRFEVGTVSRRDARNIYNEWGLRAKTTKRNRAFAVGASEEYDESQDVQGVREDD